MVEALLNQILEKLVELQSEIDQMKTKLATKEDLAAVATKGDLISIQQAILETNRIVKNIELNQERHERILDVLSKRSIEYEARYQRLTASAVKEN
ncbi:hypothetical protein PNH38_05930 [Anoxybacillus rupiensis]|uniref:Uncharacterized protein n=1 Tax=Anoxybacteroides rupiense TaxID=311460 RepID=A0ABT5W4E0_9BACL|nr:hypothetical protein [Anoxybacillus rupiensis]MDE8563425.1 hypothetical protein [Anoxybacillus rupiensis]